VNLKWNCVSHHVHMAHYTYMLGFSKAGMKFISLNIRILFSIQHVHILQLVAQWRCTSKEIWKCVHQSQFHRCAEDMKSLEIVTSRSVEVSHLLDTPVGVALTSVITIYEYVRITCKACYIYSLHDGQVIRQTDSTCANMGMYYIICKDNVLKKKYYQKENRSTNVPAMSRR
jgi:hypothetical protein